MVEVLKLLRITFCFALPLACFSQNDLDSLRAIWNDESLADSIRALALEDYIYAGPFRTQPDSAVILAEELYQFTKRSKDSFGMIEALNLKGYSSFRVGKYNDALQSYQAGLDIAEKTGDTTGAANILLRTAYIFHDNEDYLRAIDLYEKSLKLYEATNDLEGKSDVYNEYGSIYRSKGNFEKALDYYQKSLDIHDSLHDETGKSAIYSNLGNLYLDAQKTDSAILFYQKALQIDKTTNDKLGTANGLGGIGSSYLEQGKLQEALKFLKNSLKISEEINDIQGGVATRLNIGDVYLELGQYSKAIKEFEKSLSDAQKIGDLGSQEYAYEGLYECYRTIGNSTMALNYHEKMLAIGDSLNSEETAMKLQQIEFSKQAVADSLAQVEKELQTKMQHEREVRIKDRNRNIAIGVGILFLILAAGFFSRWRYVKKSKAIIEKEKNRSENLLLNILPAEIAEELKEKGEAQARDFDMVSILFTDFKGFTEQSSKVSAAELIGEINHCFKAFDLICERYGIEKIKTIGDAYMAAGGLPTPSPDSAERTISAAIEMQKFMQSRKSQMEDRGELSFEMRLGIHTGPVVAGIVGVKKFQYDVWGDTVNTASRIESNGATGKVNISQSTYEIVKDNTNFKFEHRGKVKAKGKGEIGMYYVSKVH